LYRVFVTDTATDLQDDVWKGFSDIMDNIRITWLAGYGAIQIDYMQSFGAFLDPSCGYIQWAASINGLVVHASLA
jgi:hypothetical protein